jgi:transcriptional regulator with XRE-family HTH domain
MGAYEVERDGILKDFGLNLAKLRTSKKLSQAKFAKRAKVHRNEISDLERGRRQPGLLMMLILADAAGVSLDRLVVEEPSAQDGPSAQDEPSTGDNPSSCSRLPVPRKRQPRHRAGSSRTRRA